MKSILKKVAWLVLAALALAAFGCKTDTETKYVFLDKAGETLKIALTPRCTARKRLHRKQEQHKSNCNSKNNNRK